MTTHYPKGHLLSVQFPLYHHVGISDVVVMFLKTPEAAQDGAWLV